MKYFALLLVSGIGHAATGFEFGLERRLSGHLETILVQCTEDPRAKCSLVMNAPESKPVLVKVEPVRVTQAVTEFEKQAETLSIAPKTPTSAVVMRWWREENGQRKEHSIYLPETGVSKAKNAKVEQMQKAVFKLESTLRSLAANE